LLPSEVADLLIDATAFDNEGDILKKLAAALVLGCALLATGVAGATTGRTGSGVRAAAAQPIVWGVADDASKFADDGGSWFYGQMKGASLSSNRWTLAWDSTVPTTIKELPFLERAAPKAQAAGVHVLLALYAGTPSPTATQHDPTQFCAWAGQVAATAKQWGIHDFIVWNEPNTRLYWFPQKDSNGTDVAAPAYESLLAACYDTIHAADANANVIGMGLSPRASTSESTEPLVFLRDVGKAYRASGRATPIMDQLSVHPYPNPNSPTDSPDVGYEVKDRFGISNLDRVKQAVYDAFNGTGQPTTVSSGLRTSSAGRVVRKPLTFVIDEVGWQTDTTSYSQYVNKENVATISEQTQADYIKKMAEKYFACDPTVVSVQLFLLADEKYRNGKDANGVTLGGGWQSGLLTAGGQGLSAPKAAYAQVAADFAAGRAACKGQMIAWTPAGSSAGGSGGSGGGGALGTGLGSTIVGDPDGIIDPDVQTAFENAIGALGVSQAAQPSLLQPPFAVFFESTRKTVTPLVNQIQPPPGTVLGIEGTIVACNPSPCVLSGIVNGLWAKPGSFVRRVAGLTASKVRTVATFKTTITAGKKTSVKLKSALKKGAKTPVGSYFLVVVLKNQADSTKKYGFGVQLRTVKAKAKPVKAKKK
jgi:hypothetical protein